METTISIKWRLACLVVAAVFLLTSCPVPIVEPKVSPSPVAKEDTGRMSWSYIDSEGHFTDDKDNAYGRLYWVEKDGKVQPGLVSVGRRDNMVNVVNFVDTESGSHFRMFFMDRANLPYRMVVTCRDDTGRGRTLVGSEIRYDKGLQELSIRFTDRDDSSQTAVLSEVKLNSGLFDLDNQELPAMSLSHEQYMVTMTSCLLYAIGQSDMVWREGVPTLPNCLHPPAGAGEISSPECSRWRRW